MASDHRRTADSEPERIWSGSSSGARGDSGLRVLVPHPPACVRNDVEDAAMSDRLKIEWIRV
ncbi:hypothetical protein [Mycolicibacterium fortuitum]|uniref:hypothetical protein n=1 Tax=Mycolicibacterium fortuitum TaxID=1766 RepID=UPI001CE20CBA|nr:hypothetical protein [Mycolicibacterium fortuitum]MCA4726647.1 hypothetical protein [Mycolicibacterium fortuitum]